MSLIFGWWLFIALIWSFFCWWRYTDRDASAIERQLHASALGLAWPYTLGQFAYQRYLARQGQSSSTGAGGGRSTASLPVTSYGYAPPAEATQHGWACTHTDVCGRSEHEFVQGWPKACPGCASPTDPLFDEPWSHDAAGIEVQHILRDDPEAGGGFHGDRWPVWQLKDALRSGNEQAVAPARLAAKGRADARQVEAWWGPGSVYFGVVWTELEFNRLDLAAVDLLEWLGRSSSDNAEADNTNRTNCRQVIGTAAKFLAAPGGSSHPQAPELRRRCLELATGCYPILNSEQQTAVTAMARA